MSGATTNGYPVEPVPAGVVTAMRPGCPCGGGTAGSCSPQSARKLARTPPNVTAVAPVKVMPVIRTSSPTWPPLRFELLTVGGTRKEERVVTQLRTPQTVSGPVVAARGTVAWTRVAESTVKSAGWSPNRTAVTSERLEPEIETFAPTRPRDGEKLETTGGGPTAETFSCTQPVSASFESTAIR